MGIVLCKQNPPHLNKKRQCKNYISKHFLGSKVAIQTINSNSNLKRTLKVENADIVWASEKVASIMYPQLHRFPKMKISRFPSMTFICSKNALAQQHQLFQKIIGSVIDITPPSFYLRSNSQLNLVRENMNGTDLSIILKPTYGSQGIGIRIATSFEEIEQIKVKANLVAQHYIDNPLLIEKCKFDFRAYVLLTNIDPIEAYLFHEGLARFCVLPYKKIRLSPFKPGRHLTNVSVNRREKNYKSEFKYPENESHLRTISSVLNQLKSEDNYVLETFWDDLRCICEQALAILWPLIWDRYYRRFSNNNNRIQNKCFQLLGIDVLPDETGHLWLTEINANCSFKTGPVHSKATEPIMRGIFQIFGYCDRNKNDLLYTKLNPENNYPDLTIFSQMCTRNLFDSIEPQTRRELWRYFGQKRDGMWFDGKLSFDTFCEEIVKISQTVFSSDQISEGLKFLLNDVEMLD